MKRRTFLASLIGLPAAAMADFCLPPSPLFAQKDANRETDETRKIESPTQKTVEPVQKTNETTTRLSYPNPPARMWTFPGSTRAQLIDHLLRHPNHKGNWTAETLNQLTYAELLALHSDHHDNRVKPFRRVNVATSEPAPARAVKPMVKKEYCPPNAAT